MMSRELFSTRAWKYVEKKMGAMAGVIVYMRRMQDFTSERVALARTAKLYRALSRNSVGNN